MVKTKHQKSNSKRHPQKLNKKPGKSPDISQFRAQLDLLNLQIVQVTADGNCFFRALADQLDGDQEEYGKYRKMVVQYILKNREMFEPFIEDDVPFDEYCDSMEKDGTWAGHLELQAASLVTQCNICIHRMSSPRWYIRNFEDREARMVHLSYHDEEHYNSVRSKEDTCSGPARLIIIKGDTVPSASSLQRKDLSNYSQKRGESATSPGNVKLVMAGSGCQNSKKVEKVLVEVHGDVDAAIEFLVAERAAEKHETESTLCHIDSSLGIDKTKGCEQLEERIEEKHDYVGSPSNNIEYSNCSNSQSDDKRIPRNKVCPCGSKKKHKACCGSVAASSSGTKLSTLRRLERKEKQARKVDLLKLKCPLDLMDCHMTWELFAFDLHLAEEFLLQPIWSLESQVMGAPAKLELRNNQIWEELSQFKLVSVWNRDQHASSVVNYRSYSNLLASIAMFEKNS